MLYDKTFFISDRRLSLSDDYNYINLSCGKVLSYHKRLKVTNNASCSVILLGDAWSVRDGEISPEKRVQMMTGKEGKELFDIESSWCGRYILIVGSKLYLDATGMMGCFYGDGVISNNISALRKVEGGGKLIFPPVNHELGPSFAFGPLTEYDNILRLFPSQILNIDDFSTEYRQLYQDNRDLQLNDDELFSLIEKHFITSIRNLREYYKDSKIEVAITGGRDSRITLALFKKSGIDFNAFTFWHDKITRQDKEIPKKLARVGNFKYSFVGEKYRIKDPYRFELQQEHCGGLTAERTWQSIPQLELLRGNESLVIIRSGIFELSRDYFNSKETGDNPFVVFPMASQYNTYKTALEQFTEFVKKDEVNSALQLSFADRLYYDQRLGCWLASTEQSFEFIDNVQTIQICNNRLIISLLMALSEKCRANGHHEELFVKYVYPPFASVPYDYQDLTYYERFRRIVKMIKKKLNF